MRFQPSWPSCALRYAQPCTMCLSLHAHMHSAVTLLRACADVGRCTSVPATPTMALRCLRRPRRLDAPGLVDLARELTTKTDPQNSDYVVEYGAIRNFEPWRAEEQHKQRDAEEMGDPMKSLENKTLDSQREMDIHAALDEMKSMKSRHSTVSVDEMLGMLH